MLYSNERAKSQEHLDELVEKNEELFRERLNEEVQENVMKTLASIFNQATAEKKTQNMELKTQ